MKTDGVRKLLGNIVAKSVRVPVLLWGAMGIGKSMLVRDVAASQGLPCIDLRLAQQEPGDLIGLPRTVDGRTVWSKPSWWPDPGTRGVLFFDELNRAPTDVRQAIFQVVGDWRLHTHELPPGWCIVAAANPDSGGYQVETLDPAMLRRFCQIRVVSSAVQWLEWAESAGIDDRIRAFVRGNPRLLALDEDFALEARPTPAGYEMIDRMLGAGVVPASARSEVVCGVLGLEAGTALVHHLSHKDVSFIAGEELLERYPAIRGDVLAQTHDRMHQTVVSVLDVLKDREPSGVNMANLAAFVGEVGAEWKMTVLQGLREVPGILEVLSADLELARQLVAIQAEVAKAAAQPSRR
jgi:hypothetical protein